MAATNGPIGIFGGTFDPIHYGHLRLAEEAGDRLRLAEVRFIPAGSPPHRTAPGADAAHRLAMAKLAIAGNDRFTVDDREVRRAGPGYTVDTLTELRAEVGTQRPLALLMGADAFLDLATWRRWASLFELAHIVVAYRPGFPVDAWQARMPVPLAREYGARLAQQPLAVHLAPAGGVFVLPIAELDIAATGIRHAVSEGMSPRYLLPDSVLDYIEAEKLYRKA
ncbi:MAG TPA: nicotinate-nucleotide adenylyltransferase [Burkholderiales bacterium]|nr:nicotinate-nucleotide adenylyltransferase [Burkholderiales bacterium]